MGFNERVYHVVVAPDQGAAYHREFATTGDLLSFLRTLMEQKVQAFCFQGYRLRLTRGTPGIQQFLRIDGQFLPLAVEAELEEDPEGWLGGPPPVVEEPVLSPEPPATGTPSGAA